MWALVNSDCAIGCDKINIIENRYPNRETPISMIKYLQIIPLPTNQSTPTPCSANSVSLVGVLLTCRSSLWHGTKLLRSNCTSWVIVRVAPHEQSGNHPKIPTWSKLSSLWPTWVPSLFKDFQIGTESICTACIREEVNVPCTTAYVISCDLCKFICFVFYTCLRFKHKCLLKTRFLLEEQFDTKK